MTGSENDLSKFEAILKGKFSASVSAVVVFGNDEFTSPESYEGPFTSFSGNIGHAKGAFSYSSTSFAISLGATTSKTSSWGISKTNYILLADFVLVEKQSATTVGRSVNRAKNPMDRKLLI